MPAQPVTPLHLSEDYAAAPDHDPVGRLVGEAAGLAKARLGAAVDELAEEVAIALEHGGELCGRIDRQARRAVREHPVAVGLIAGATAAAAYLLLRRKSRPPLM